MDVKKNKSLLHNCKLYGIIDTGYVKTPDFIPIAKALCDAGIGILQFRAKDWSPSKILPHATALKDLCQSYDCLFVVNDFPTVAAEINADALHIGQDDGTLNEVREIVGDSILVGRSTHSPEQAQKALNDGFDYIGFGPLFPTPTKAGRPGIGLNHIAAIESSVGSKIPVFCIGGIKASNLDEVIAAGARRVVIVSDILQSQNPQVHVAKILSKLDK